MSYGYIVVVVGVGEDPFALNIEGLVMVAVKILVLDWFHKNNVFLLDILQGYSLDIPPHHTLLANSVLFDHYTVKILDIVHYEDISVFPPFHDLPQTNVPGS